MAFGCNVSQLSSETAIRKALQKSDTFQKFVHSHIKQKNSNSTCAERLIEKTVQWWRNWQPYVLNFVALPHHHTLLLRLPPLNESEVEKCNNFQHVFDKQSNTNLHKLNQQSSASICMSFTDTVVVILTIINGELCVMDHAFVKSIEPKHFYNLPSV